MRRFPKTLASDFAAFEKLDTPAKVQDFLDAMPINKELRGDTYRSPLMTLRSGVAHCMEGALLAAAAFWYNGERPLILDLKTTDDDVCHVVALFRRGGLWGAASKTNHAVLRYRDPVYKTPRELAMSYFNEYFLDDGSKTLRSFSKPFDLLEYDDEWLTSRKHLHAVVIDLDRSPHEKILARGAEKALRKADSIEIRAGKLVEWE